MQTLRTYVFLPLTFVANPVEAQTAPAEQIIMGDSLSASYGIDIQQGWVNLLAAVLEKSHVIKMINASVSGETSSGGKARLPALLEEHEPDIVVLELGGNDGLRGQPLKLLENNLQ